MKFIRVRGWFREEVDPQRRFLIEEVEGIPIAVEGRLYFLTRDSSGTYSVYEAQHGALIFGGQTLEQTRRIISIPGFRERADSSIAAFRKQAHGESDRMRKSVKEKYEKRGRKDEQLRNVWKIANRQYVTREDAEWLKRMSRK